jgi:gliding motility-associated-like protein
MKRRIVILLVLLLAGCLDEGGIEVFGQTASFTAPDTVCVNTPVTITNTSTNATTYNWNFCIPDPAAQASAVSFGNVGNKMELSVYMDYVQVNGNYYGFVVNNTPGGLVRLDFGNSLMNTPTAMALGDFGGKLTKSALGIQIVQNSGRWYAFIMCGDDNVAIKTTPSILMVDFGASITNTSPAATNWGNVGGGLKYAHELFMFQEPDGNWYGITISYWNSTLTRFSFGKDFNIAPTAVNFTKANLGVLNGPTGLWPVKWNGNWHLFVTNFDNNSLARIDFGNSLLNNPTSATSVNLGNPGNKLFKTRDIILFPTCDEIAGYIANDDGNVIRLSFKNITDVPTAYNAGKVADNIVSFSKTFRQDGEVYSFIPSYIPVGLNRLKFPSCGSSSIAGSTQATLPAISYPATGTYNINLRVDKDLPTESVFCKRIVVVAPQNTVATGTATICPGDSVRLTATHGTTYQWLPNIGLSHPNAASTMASPPVTTSYTVHATDRLGCTTQATVAVTVKQLPIFTVSASPESVCPGDTVTLTASGGDTYEWTGSNGVNASSVRVVPLNATPYQVKIYENICKITGMLSVSVDIKKPPAIHVSKSGDIDCSTSEVTLSASGGNDYQWSPATGLSSVTSPNPTVRIIQNTTYTATTTGLNGCKNTDSVTVLVLGTGADNAYYMPSAFTPNGDGLNDCFGLIKWGAVSQLQFNIYDRWGALVFSSNNATRCWDGNYKNIQQPPGTYMYHIKAITTCGEIERKGTIVLIR